MTSTAQHIALLTALGWTKANLAAAQTVADIDRRATGIRRDSFTAWDLSTEMENAEGNSDYVGRLPDLTLDMMARAEATLDSQGLAMRYLNELEIVTDTCNATTQQWRFACATKEQRLEAFLRATSRWIP